MEATAQAATEEAQEPAAEVIVTHAVYPDTPSPRKAAYLQICRILENKQLWDYVGLNMTRIYFRLLTAANDLINRDREALRLVFMILGDAPLSDLPVTAGKLVPEYVIHSAANPEKSRPIPIVVALTSEGDDQTAPVRVSEELHGMTTKKLGRVHVIKPPFDFEKIRTAITNALEADRTA